MINTKQQFVELDERYSNNIQVINKRCENNTAAIQKLRVEKMEEVSDETGLQIRKIQREFSNKLASINNQPCNHNITNEQLKNIRYNGTGDFPMEFMKEMEDVYMEYYQDNGNVAWIGRHLEGEAAVWWRVIKNSGTNFAEFKEAFTNKYWSDMIQERVRNELEFGRYQMESGMNMIQYLERKLLENRQLIPPIPDQYLIRKIAKHYSQGVQIAIITRGVTTISEFEQVLSEFMGVRSETRTMTRTHYDTRREHKPWVRDEEESGKRIEQGRAHDNENRSNTQHYNRRPNKFRNEPEPIPSTSGNQHNKSSTAISTKQGQHGTDDVDLSTIKKYINTVALDLEDDALNNDDISVEYCINKCPEIRISLNEMPLYGLIDKGSQVNAISEKWFKNNKNKLGNVETSRLSNTKEQLDRDQKG